jgi:hypothetical protein
MKVIETWVTWSGKYQDYVMVYMCQSVNSQEIAYFAQHEGELWKPSELELKQLLNEE